MSHEQVCSWLGLPPGNWPPDHYTLLGLDPGESDLERIEQRIHDRLTLLRSRQLHHPDQVSEAMNLLARAFSCLLDPEAKRCYDAALLGRATGVNGQAADQTKPPWYIVMGSGGGPEARWIECPGGAASWLAGWFSETPSASPPTSTASAAGFVFFGVSATDETEAAANPPPAAPPTVPPAPPPAPKPIDHITTRARSPSARRGLGTKRALYYRIARTRRLLAAWERAGKFLGHPKRRVLRTKEAEELTRQLDAIVYYLESFPPLLGEAGQTGFYVVSLANQEMVVPTFRMLLPSQRETLARDWRDGQKLLSAHLLFLRHELRALRQARWWTRLVRAVDTALTDHPALLLLFVCLVAILVVIVSFLKP
jgi:hypothetical protein